MSNDVTQTQKTTVLVNFDYQHTIPGVVAIFQWSDGTETRRRFSSRGMAFDYLREIQREGGIKPAEMT
jgi:hypothetical protein